MTANAGWIFLSDSLYPSFEIEPTITPIKGSPTPVRTNAIIAVQKYSPLENPSAGGKIKLPAPKNMANKVNPTIMTCFVLMGIASSIIINMQQFYLTPAEKSTSILNYLTFKL